MAYQSLEAGRPQIFVQRYPELGRRQPISTDGGRLPLWGPDGRTLFFSSLDSRHMFVVQVEAGTTLAAGRPREWFDLPTVPSGWRPAVQTLHRMESLSFSAAASPRASVRRRRKSSSCSTGSRS